MDLPVIDRPTAPSPAPGCEHLLRSVAATLPAMQNRAAELDREARFPTADFSRLRRLGVLAAPLPRAAGGLGLGTEPEGADALRRRLLLLGRCNPSVGRLFEAHVNASALIARYGSAAQLRRTATDVRAGDFFALWVTGAPNDLALVERPGVERPGVERSGVDPSGPQMLIANVEDARATPLKSPPQGMRAAANGVMLFDDLPAPPDSLLGAPGNYLREPAFSAGAWRTSAVVAGGLQALVQAARDQLVARGRDRPWADRPASSQPA